MCVVLHNFINESVPTDNNRIVLGSVEQVYLCKTLKMTKYVMWWVG